MILKSDITGEEWIWSPSMRWGEMNWKAVFDMRRNKLEVRLRHEERWDDMSLDHRKREAKRREEERREEKKSIRKRERERQTDRQTDRERFICLYYCFYFHKFVLFFLPLRTFCLVHFLVFSHFFISHLNSFVLNIHLLIL